MTSSYTGKLIMPRAAKEKINTIKALREVFGCSLATGKELSETHLRDGRAMAPVIVTLEQLGRLLVYQRSFTDTSRILVDIVELHPYHDPHLIDLT